MLTHARECALAEPTLDPIGEPARDRATAAALSPVRFELITARAGFDALEDEWNALFERAGRGVHMFQTFNWNWHWANHFLGLGGDASEVQLSIIVGRRDGRLVTVWPLVKQTLRGVTQIFWMGEPITQYGDVLIDHSPDATEILRAGWAYLTSQAKADVVRLRRVRADATIAPLMKEIGADVSDRQVAPFLDLSSAKSYADYEERFSARSRRNRRRLARRFAEQEGVVMERHIGGERAAALAVTALELKAAWLKDRGLTSNAIADERTARFFADAAEGRVKSTNCIVSTLMANGEAAALEVSFECRGRLAMHVIVFNLKYEKAAAGVLRLEQSLRDGFDDGLEIFDMLAPGDAYKLDWADGVTEVIDWAKPQTLAGLAYTRVYLGFVRSRAKAAIKAVPPSLRRVLTGGYLMAAAM